MRIAVLDDEPFFRHLLVHSLTGEEGEEDQDAEGGVRACVLSETYSVILSSRSQNFLLLVRYSLQQYTKDQKSKVLVNGHT